MKTLPLLFGIDFSSAPSASKPVVLAAARLAETGGHVTCDVLSLMHFRTLDALEQFLADSPPWVAAIDMPFGLSRLVTEVLQWPGAGATSDQVWDIWTRFYTALSRAEIREIFQAWCNAHPPGQKFAHRASDRPAKSSPSMKWVNPPVAYMLHAGAALLQRLDAYIPGMRPGGRRDRLALEAYPGFMARQLLGAASYKNDDASRQTPAREDARRLLIGQIATVWPQLSVNLHPDIEAAMLTDGKGDALDAVLCVIQAALAWQRDAAGFDLPPDTDRLEGWIVNVPWRDAVRSPDCVEQAEAERIRTAVYASISPDTRRHLLDLGAGVPETLLP